MKVSPKQYAQLLNELAFEAQNQEKLDDSIKKFVVLIKRNNNISSVDKIIEEFEKLILAKSGVELVEVESTKELNREMKEKIKIAVSQKKDMAKEKIKLVAKKNSDLIGGVRVKIGNEEIDGSIRSKLSRLQLSLT
ncbi:MAG: ATP synthase F1 subunit delta [Patescibacteria group bacterium]|nr:ATP synthase F1 subunit delta [Patescibacteria group bacterium]